MRWSGTGSGTRGYSSYRGRGGKWRLLAALLLLLVIAGSVGFILAREHMVYDADGTLHFDLPWKKQPEAPAEPAPDGDVVIREPEPTADAAPVRGILLSAQPQTAETWTEELAGTDADLAAVTVKDSTGRIWSPLPGAVAGAVVQDQIRDESLVRLMARTDVAKAARFSCFHDPKAADHDVDGMGLKNTGGYIFYDGNNSRWLDPGLPKARTYLTDLLRSAAEEGYDEIILTDVSYPTVGKLDKIDFSHALSADGTDGRGANLAAFLKEARDVLPEGVVLSLELDAETVRTGADADAGQVLDQLAPLVDRIYAKTTETEVPALAAAVKAASETCGFVPELTEVPAGGLEDWLLVQS